MKLEKYVLDGLVTFCNEQQRSSEKMGMSNITQDQMITLRGSYATYAAVLAQIEKLTAKYKKMMEKEEND